VSDELIMGRRNSLRETIAVAALASMLLPGIGVLVIPTMFTDEPPPWPLTLWTVFWGLVPFIVRWLQRTHQIVGDELVSTYHRRTETRSLADVVELRPLRWYLPGSADRVRRRPRDLRPRRIVWLVIGFAALLSDPA
jgi:hypothetical protein